MRDRVLVRADDRDREVPRDPGPFVGEVDDRPVPDDLGALVATALARTSSPESVSGVSSADGANPFW